MGSVFKRIFIAVVLVVMTSTGVWASAELTFSDITVAQEFASGTDGLVKDFFSGDLGTDANNSAYITGGTTSAPPQYLADLGLNLDWTLTFTLTNGVFYNADLSLMVNNDDGTGAEFCGAHPALLPYEVGELIDGGEGESFARFIITGGCDVPENTTLYLTSDQEDITASIAVLTYATGAGDEVSLAVTDVRTDGQVAINTAKADAVPLLTLVKQFSAEIDSKGVDTIDVAQGRLFFEAFPGKDYSHAFITFTNNTAGIDDEVTVDADDTLDITLISSGDFSAIDFLSFEGPVTDDEFFAGDDFLTTDSSFTFTVDAGGANGRATAGSNTWDFDIFVTGEDVIKVRTFDTTVVLNLNDEPNTEPTLYANEETFVWTINGWVGTVPYMYAGSTQAEDTFIKIFNNSTIDADVTVDITTDGGTTATVTLAPIPQGTVGIFWAQDIATTAGISLNSAFAAEFTVNAEKNDITAMAVQKRLSGSERVIPVYTGDEAGTYKNF